MTDATAFIALILASITFYFQFFWKRRGIILTLISVECHAMQLRAVICITNTGDTPAVITDLRLLFFFSHGGGGQPGNTFDCKPLLPTSIAPRSHQLFVINNAVSHHYLNIYRRKSPDLIEDTNYQAYIVGGISLNMITDSGHKAWTNIQLFQLGLNESVVLGSSYLDRPINLLKYPRLKIAKAT